MFALGDVEFVFSAQEEAVGTRRPPPRRKEDPLAAIAGFKAAHEKVLNEIGKVVIGQREVINQMLVALFARGHCLLIGVPGLAKTLMVRTLGSAIDLGSHRIQFTPDLMPSATQRLPRPPLPAQPDRERDHHRGRQREPGDGILQVVVLEMNLERPGFGMPLAGYRRFQIDIERRDLVPSRAPAPSRDDPA